MTNKTARLGNCISINVIVHEKRDLVLHFIFERMPVNIW